MGGVTLSEFDYEILDWLAQDEETTAIIVNDLRNPTNADRFSEAMKAMDFEDVDRAIRRLAEIGLVEGHQQPSDGFRMEPGASYTWWGLTDEGRRTWEAWDAAQPPR